VVSTRGNHLTAKNLGKGLGGSDVDRAIGKPRCGKTIQPRDLKGLPEQMGAVLLTIAMRKGIHKGKRSREQPDLEGGLSSFRCKPGT